MPPSWREVARRSRDGGSHLINTPPCEVYPACRSILMRVPAETDSAIQRIFGAQAVHHFPNLVGVGVEVLHHHGNALGDGVHILCVQSPGGDRRRAQLQIKGFQGYGYQYHEGSDHSLTKEV